MRYPFHICASSQKAHLLTHPRDVSIGKTPARTYWWSNTVKSGIGKSSRCARRLEKILFWRALHGEHCKEFAHATIEISPSPRQMSVLCWAREGMSSGWKKAGPPKIMGKRGLTLCAAITDFFTKWRPALPQDNASPSKLLLCNVLISKFAISCSHVLPFNAAPKASAAGSCPSKQTESPTQSGLFASILSTIPALSHCVHRGSAATDFSLCRSGHGILAAAHSMALGQEALLHCMWAILAWCVQGSLELPRFPARQEPDQPRWARP